MKKLLPLIAIPLLCIAAFAAVVYNAALVNQTALAYSQNFVLNLNTTPNASGIKALTAQAIYSSATLTTNTFTDGKVSTGAFTVVSTTSLVAANATDMITFPSTTLLTPQSATNKWTVTSAAGLAGQYIMINGAIFQDSLFDAPTASGTALGLANYLNSFYSNQFVSTVTTGGTVIFSTAAAGGTQGNQFTFFSSSPTALAAGSLNFVGGTNSALTAASITVNGVRYHQGYIWHDTGISSTTAQSFHDTVLQFVPGITSTVTVSGGIGIISATATVAGTAGNGFTFSASTPAITFGSANFSGGQSPAQVCINGSCLTEGNQWNIGASSTTALTATSIASAINTALSTIVKAQASGSVVTSTSASVGTLSNYPLSSSTPTAITASGPAMVAGSNSAYTISTGVINIPNHGLTTGYGVTYSTNTSNTTVAPLVNNTVYYAIFVDANDIELATSLANAKAGTFITLTSSSTVGPHTFTLTPAVFSGTAGLQWQVSNDPACLTGFQNYTTNALGVAISSITFATPFTAGSTSWNLGPVGYACIQAAITGPSTGGWAIKVNVNGTN